MGRPTLGSRRWSYDLKEAQENFQDAAVLDESTDTQQYQEGQKNLQDAPG